MRVRKKPVEVEAVRWWGKLNDLTEWPDWFRDAVEAGQVEPSSNEPAFNRLMIHTPEGTMAGESGDYIIRGVKGELYPCKPDVFEATYDVVT